MATPARDRLTRILWPSEAPVDEGRDPYTPPPPQPLDVHMAHLEARIVHPLAAVAAELHAIREALAPEAGDPFSLPNGAICDGTGNGFVLYDGPRPGNVWRVELVIVSVTGASAAATVEAYNNGPTPDEENMVGVLGSLNGNNPSRGFLALARPAVVFGGQPFLVRVLGAAAGAQITCRIQGENQAIGGD
jgi:hypothetical protein